MFSLSSALPYCKNEYFAYYVGTGRQEALMNMRKVHIKYEAGKSGGSLNDNQSEVDAMLQ